MSDEVRAALEALIEERGEDYSSVSRLLGRNAAYIQQFIKRGTPRILAEEDRRKLAAYFRVPEEQLGGRGAAAALPASLISVPRVEVRASAGPGGLAEIEELGRPIGFDMALLREIGAKRSSSLSIIRVKGDSMEPGLRDGDDILVDRDQAVPRHDAIHVIRLDGLLMVKRLLKDGDRWIVHSDNPAHGEIADYDPALLEIIGRVLWCGRKL